MLFEKARQQRHDMQTSESGRGRDPQAAGEPCPRAARGKLRLVSFLDRGLRSLVEPLTGFGRAQPVRRADEQIYLKPVLQLGDRL